MKVNLEQSCSLIVLGCRTLFFSLSSSCRSTLLLLCHERVYRSPLSCKLLILRSCLLLLLLSSCRGPCFLHALLIGFTYGSPYLKRCHLPLKRKKVIIILDGYLQLSFEKLLRKVTSRHPRLLHLLSNAILLISMMSWITWTSSRCLTFTIAVRLIVLIIALSIMSEHRLRPLYWPYHS